MKISRVFLFTLWLPLAFAGPLFDDFLRSREWKQYLIALRPCQKKSPTYYLPLELYRIDLLPEGDFVPQAKAFGAEWEALSKKEFKSGRTLEEEAISCRANESLNALMATTQKQLKRPLKGSSTQVLEAIPEEMRAALSVIDPLFLKNTDIGKKAQSDLNKKSGWSLRAVTFNEKKQVIDFEGQNMSRPNENKAFYELKFNEMQGNKLRFRGVFKGKSDPVGSDLLLRREYIGGTAFNPQTKSTPYPFGPYPRAKEIWSDGTGHTHFEGDGHNHDGHDHAH